VVSLGVVMLKVRFDVQELYLKIGEEGRASLCALFEDEMCT